MWKKAKCVSEARTETVVWLQDDEKAVDLSQDQAEPQPQVPLQCPPSADNQEETGASAAEVVVATVVNTVQKKSH